MYKANVLSEFICVHILGFDHTPDLSMTSKQACAHEAPVVRVSNKYLISQISWFSVVMIIMGLDTQSQMEMMTHPP